MLNEEYRRQRGTDHPFNVTPEEAQATWHAINGKAIDAKRAYLKRRRTHTTPWAYAYQDDEK